MFIVRNMFNMHNMFHLQIFVLLSFLLLTGSQPNDIYQTLTHTKIQKLKRNIVLF